MTIAVAIQELVPIPLLVKTAPKDSKSIYWYCMPIIALTPDLEEIVTEGLLV